MAVTTTNILLLKTKTQETKEEHEIYRLKDLMRGKENWGGAKMAIPIILVPATIEMANLFVNSASVKSKWEFFAAGVTFLGVTVISFGKGIKDMKDWHLSKKELERLEKKNKQNNIQKTGGLFG